MGQRTLLMTLTEVHDDGWSGTHRAEDPRDNRRGSDHNPEREQFSIVDFPSEAIPSSLALVNPLVPQIIALLLTALAFCIDLPLPVDEGPLPLALVDVALVCSLLKKVLFSAEPRNPLEERIALPLLLDR